jgi:hypothetical protein
MEVTARYLDPYKESFRLGEICSDCERDDGHSESARREFSISLSSIGAGLTQRLLSQ